MCQYVCFMVLVWDLDSLAAIVHHKPVYCVTCMFVIVCVCVFNNVSECHDVCVSWC